MYHLLVRKGTVRHLTTGTFAKCPAARHRHFFVTRSSDLHTLSLTGLRKMAPRFGVFLGFCLLGVKFLFHGYQGCRHAGQPLDISTSMRSSSAMVVLNFLSILGTSFRLLRLVRPRSFVTWCISVRVLILSVFIICSSRLSLCTSQLGWQGMTV